MPTIDENAGLSACVIELQSSSKPELVSDSAISNVAVCGAKDSHEESHELESQRPPETAILALENWNHPKGNILRTFSTFLSFTIMGANDAAYGALIPYLEAYYGLSYTIVSLVFLTPLCGYTAAALLNNIIHIKFGQRGVAWLSPGFHTLAYIINSLHPPYPVLVISFIFAGFGNGLADCSWNAWTANLANANEVLGFLHGFYGLGATLSPFIATTMITKGSLPWYTFYYIMIGASVLELLFCLYAFWTANAQYFREATARGSDHRKQGNMREALFTKPSSKVTWLCAAFLLGYVGLEVGLGGWIVVFMTKVRGGSAFASGMTATGFWMGLTVGRVILGFVTPRLGEKLAISIYLPTAMVFELIFWLVPQFYVSAVAVALQSFFLGPLYPAAVVAAAKLLPRHLHVTSIGFAAAVGGIGAAVFPFAVGAIAQSKGVQVLQPFILALLVAILGIWLALPRISKATNSD